MWDKLVESFDVLLIGMLGVFSSLAFFSFLIWVLKKSDNFFKNKSINKSLEKIHSETEKEGFNPDEELIAVISAAATAALKRPVKIRTIHFLDSKNDSWASSGRIQVMASHQISKRN